MAVGSLHKKLSQDWLSDELTAGPVIGYWKWLGVSADNPVHVQTTVISWIHRHNNTVCADTLLRKTRYTRPAGCIMSCEALYDLKLSLSFKDIVHDQVAGHEANVQTASPGCATSADTLHTHPAAAGNTDQVTLCVCSSR